ncbi:hypothetical protein WJX74_003107 [Apatococcus lobatus]|uniref:Endonuclease/exonuclease/phosphatase domain-containing protein n=1 Tax=Apatococcus lobatus TaxID=904363 RepID=A0AAW1S8V1_9CHLO
MQSRQADMHRPPCGCQTRFLPDLKTCPLDWEDKSLPAAGREPRRGQRAILAANFATPQGPLLCYNLHMEVFCGMLARIEQFTAVFRDSREQLQKGMYHQAIMGDLNTMAHGIARLSPNFCNDRMRFLSLGQSEAEFWHHNLFMVTDPAFEPSRDKQNQHLAGGSANPINQKLQWWGMPEHVCKEALNPGFHDPWDPQQDITLDNPRYRILGFSMAAGKLDWLLMRRLQLVGKDCGNHDYSASDHKWLQADVQLAGPL